jgi:hypothetical protein
LVEKVLLDIEGQTTTHGHRFRVISREWDVLWGGEISRAWDVFVQVVEPGKCECRADVRVNDLIHLLNNITDDERAGIITRDFDALGHPHHPRTT